MNIKPNAEEGPIRPGSPLQYYQDDEISLKEVLLKLKVWWQYLISKWKIILIAGVSGAVLGFIHARKQKPVYKAELSFVIEGESSGGGGAYAGIASQFGLDIGGGGAGGVFSGENLLDLMKSRSLVEKALLTTVSVNGRKETLVEYYIQFNNYRDAWDQDPHLKGVKFLPGADRTKFSLKQDSILGSFYKNIISGNLILEKKDPKSGIMRLTVQSEDELFAKLFTETLTKEVSDFYVETKTKKSVENLAILQQQTDSVRRALNSAISGVASSVDANPNANAALQILRAPSQRRTVDVQANQAILTELVKNLEMAKISVRKETPLIQIIDRPILPLEVERYSKVKAVVIGGILGGFFMTVVLLIRKLFSNVMA